MPFINVVSCLIYSLLIKPDLAQPALKSYVDEPLFRVFYFMEQEIWKDIPDYEGYYQASNLGRIRSLDRFANKIFYKSQLIKPNLINSGYLVVRLRKHGIQKPYLVHRLIAQCFLCFDFSNKSTVIDHINNIKTDNRLCNLQQITARANVTKDKRNVGATINTKCKNRKWVSKIKYNGKPITLGFYKTQQEAINAYNIAAKQIENKTFIHTPLRIKISNYKGVTFDKSRNKWVAFTSENGKNKYLGRFLTEQDAHNAVKAYKYIIHE